MSTLINAESLVEFIANTTHELVMPATLKSRVATACLEVALDHHHGITVLVVNQRLASAFALTRAVFESFLRGAWVAHCASDEQIEKFAMGWEPPKIDCLLAELEMNSGYDNKTLSTIKSSAWRTMCAYTHTGGLQIQRWQTETSVEPKYDGVEVEEVLAFVNIFACLSAIELVGISGSEAHFEALEQSLASYLPTASLTSHSNGTG